MSLRVSRSVRSRGRLGAAGEQVPGGNLPSQLCFDDYASELLDQLCDESPPVLSARLPLDLQLHKPVQTIRITAEVL